MFQCSSASRKFLNVAGLVPAVGEISFSALQRAENSSIIAYSEHLPAVTGFQCSSASRKFLNSSALQSRLERTAVSVLFSEPKIPQSLGSLVVEIDEDVSVLFSEPKIPQCGGEGSGRTARRVSVLFSEPKIPQSTSAGRDDRTGERVSVLFSEPKIPQYNPALHPLQRRPCFSALQRAENSSIYEFSTSDDGDERVSVLFSEPKIPQW